MTRFPDWQSRLEAYLTANRNCKFSYGQVDCCLFVCSGILAMTGVDPAAPFRGNYRTRAEAFAAVKAYCGKASLRALVAQVTMEHNMMEMFPTRLGRGDLAMVRRGKREVSLGIISLNGRTVEVVTPKGLQQVSTSFIVKGWRV